MEMVQLLLLQGEPFHHRPLLTAANTEAVAKAPGAQVFAAVSSGLWWNGSPWSKSNCAIPMAWAANRCWER